MWETEADARSACVLTIKRSPRFYDQGLSRFCFCLLLTSGKKLVEIIQDALLFLDRWICGHLPTRSSIHEPDQDRQRPSCRIRGWLVRVQAMRNY